MVSYRIRQQLSVIHLQFDFRIHRSLLESKKHVSSKMSNIFSLQETDSLYWHLFRCLVLNSQNRAVVESHIARVPLGCAPYILHFQGHF